MSLLGALYSAKIDCCHCGKVVGSNMQRLIAVATSLFNAIHSFILPASVEDPGLSLIVVCGKYRVAYRDRRNARRLLTVLADSSSSVKSISLNEAKQIRYGE